MGGRAAACRLTLAIAALVASGCGSDRETASPEPTPYPVAFEIDRSVASRLPEGDAYETIERTGSVVGATNWEMYFALALDAWLSERGIDVGAPEFDDVASRLADEQSFNVIFITGEHERALARLRPRERRLTRYYELFSEESFAPAGKAMLEWLEIFRDAAQSADPDSVVVIRLID